MLRNCWEKLTMRQKRVSVFLMAIMLLAVLAVVGFSTRASGQENKEKPKPTAEQPVSRNASDNPDFCASIGPCRASEALPCAGYGNHVCVTVGNSRYFCHDCNGRGECLQKPYCASEFWYCQKIR